MFYNNETIDHLKWCGLIAFSKFSNDNMQL